VDFTIVYPPELGEPDAVYVDTTSASVPIVSLVYDPQPGLPEASGADVGMVITQFQAQVDEFFIKKMLSGTDIETVAIGASEGFWLDGGPHTIEFVDANGEPGSRSARLVSSNTLFWDVSGVTYRIESKLSKDESLRLGRSMSQ
jgi:hypothetical protein